MLETVAAPAGTVLFLLLRPDPFLVSRLLVDAERWSAADGSANCGQFSAASGVPEMPASMLSTVLRPARRGGQRCLPGAAVMVITQMAMVAS